VNVKDRNISMNSLFFLLFSFIVCLANAALLDDYVNSGPAYVKYDILPELALNGTGKVGTKGMSWTAQAVNVTSQKWLTEDDWGADWGGKDAQWWHLVYIITPSEIKTPGWKTLYVTGGQNDDKQYDANNMDMQLCGTLAMTTGQVTVSLFQVPNVPFYIKSEPNEPRLTQDAALAHTFVHYMDYIKNGGNEESLTDAEWIVLLPMVKAGFAAIKVVDEIMGDSSTSNWQVTGASKRGWTSWLMGAVDASRPVEQQKIRSILPIVLDGLNFHEFFHLHYDIYGGWSFTMQKFVDVGFTGRIDTSEMKSLLKIMDPYNYLDRLKGMPKFVSDSTGDEWFIPDDARNWIDKAKENGPIHLSMIPDADHSMVTGLASLIPNLGTFIHNVAQGVSNPNIEWTTDYENGQIIVHIDEEYKDMKYTVQMWHSTTCHGDSPRRDFRMVNMDFKNTGSCPCGPAVPGNDDQCFNLRAGIWRNSTLTADIERDSFGLTYSASLTPPPKLEKRWEAMFLTVTFHHAASINDDNDEMIVENLTESDGCQAHLIGSRKTCLPVVFPGDIMLATQVMVLPDTKPYSCKGEECQGDGILL
jgi:PhoPQ-activated pathogenicity-related protein